MVNLELEYQPFSFLKYTRKIGGQYPSKFDELKPRQLIAIAKLISTETCISEIAFLNFMTGISKFWIKNMGDYNRFQLMLLFNPFTEIQPLDFFIIPGIKSSEVSLVSPKPKLAGMTFGQFVFIESYFTDYQLEKRPADLYKFIACLYLPAGKHFNEDDIRPRDLDNKKIDAEILDAIVINFLLIKEWLALAYPLIFQHDHEEEEMKPKKIKKHQNNSAWLKIFENVVGDDLINEDKYAALPLHNVLRWMTNKVRENMKRK